MPANKPVMEHRESREFRTVYVNAYQVRFGENDVALTLGARLGDENTPDFVQNEVRVMMTPRSVKVLTLALTRIIETFEQKHGPIELSEGKEQEIADAVEMQTIKR